MWGCYFFLRVKHVALCGYMLGVHTDADASSLSVRDSVQHGAARWLFTVGDDTPERFLEVKSLVYRYAYKGALARHAAAYGRTRGHNGADLAYAKTQAEALRLHDLSLIHI